jgi:Family of unknown function (DUF5990)
VLPWGFGLNDNEFAPSPTAIASRIDSADREEATARLLRTGRPSSPDNDDVQIRIEAVDLPGKSCGPSPDRPGGYHNIHVGVQRRGRPDELLNLVPGDAPYAAWTVDCAAVATPTGVDLRGPYIQGPPGGRFIYLSWGTVGDDKNFTLFRRAKLWLNAIPPGVLDDALEVGLLVGRLGLTDRKGNPLCAAVRPPAIEWLAATQR